MLWTKNKNFQNQLNEIWSNLTIIKQDINDLISKAGRLECDLAFLRGIVNNKLSGKGRKSKEEQQDLKDSVLLPDNVNNNPWTKDY